MCISLFYFVASNIGRKLATGVVRIAAEEQYDGGIRGSHVVLSRVFGPFIWGECSHLHHRLTEGETTLINVAKPGMWLFKVNITLKLERGPELDLGASTRMTKQPTYRGSVIYYYPLEEQTPQHNHGKVRHIIIYVELTLERISSLVRF